MRPSLYADIDNVLLRLQVAAEEESIRAADLLRAADKDGPNQTRYREAVIKATQEYFRLVEMRRRLARAALMEDYVE